MVATGQRLISHLPLSKSNHVARDYEQTACDIDWRDKPL